MLNFRKLRWIKVIFLLLLIPVSYFVYSLFKNEAPITKGDIEYNIQFKEGKKLDVYYPTENIIDKSPIILFIHGGAWIGGVKEAVNFNRINDALNKLRDKGYTIVSPEYTLARDGLSPFPNCIIDAYDALEWVKKNADLHHLDTMNIGLIGESAGAHIAMMLAFGKPSDFKLGYQKTKFNYLIDIYGPNNMYDLYNSAFVDTLNNFTKDFPEKLQTCLDVPSKLFGFDPTIDSIKTRKFADQFSPILYVQEEVPRTLIIHGTKDKIVNINQSRQLKTLLDSLNVTSNFHQLEGVDHAFREINTQQKEKVQEWIYEFVVGGK